MSALEAVTRIVLVLARHPAVQSAAKRLVRDATASVIRQIRHQSRGGVRVHHIS